MTPRQTIACRRRADTSAAICFESASGDSSRRCLKGPARLVPSWFQRAGSEAVYEYMDVRTVGRYPRVIPRHACRCAVPRPDSQSAGPRLESLTAHQSNRPLRDHPVADLAFRRGIGHQPSRLAPLPAAVSGLDAAHPAHPRRGFRRGGSSARTTGTWWWRPCGRAARSRR